MQSSYSNLRSQCCSPNFLFIKIFSVLLNNPSSQSLMVTFLKVALCSFTPGVHKSRALQPIGHITPSSNFHINFTKVFSCMATCLNSVVGKLSFINRTTRSAIQGYTQSALSECTKKVPLSPRRYFAPSSIINIIFSKVFRLIIVLYFNLVLFQEISKTHLTKQKTFKKCIQGAISACNHSHKKHIVWKHRSS